MFPLTRHGSTPCCLPTPGTIELCEGAPANLPGPNKATTVVVANSSRAMIVLKGWPFQKAQGAVCGVGLTMNHGDAHWSMVPSSLVAGAQPPIPTSWPSARASTRKAPPKTSLFSLHGQVRLLSILAFNQRRVTMTKIGNFTLAHLPWSPIKVNNGARNGFSYSSASTATMLKSFAFRCFFQRLMLKSGFPP